jgi:hypothetical protein
LELDARAVPLSAKDPDLQAVGRLRYVGGVQLTARDVRFGGISGLLWESGCNRLLAVTDSGAWIAIEPEESGDRLTGVRRAWIAPLNGLDGPPLSKRAADAESVTRLADGSSWVFYEQDHRGERFADVSACRPETLARRPDRRWVPPEVSGWPPNGGMEAVAGQGERFLILSEAYPAADARRQGLAGKPEGPLASFGWQAPAQHEPTDMAALDPGTAGERMLVLHRSFSPMTGVSVILAEGRFPESLPARVEARVIAQFRPPLTVDNMEGLAVRADGERRYVYLASDDNFNALQRTLLLKFELLPETP